jgi:hypothetical protein
VEEEDLDLEKDRPTSLESPPSSGGRSGNRVTGELEVAEEGGEEGREHRQAGGAFVEHVVAVSQGVRMGSEWQSRDKDERARRESGRGQSSRSVCDGSVRKELTPLYIIVVSLSILVHTTSGDRYLSRLLGPCSLPIPTQNIFSSTHHIKSFDTCMEH